MKSLVQMGLVVGLLAVGLFAVGGARGEEQIPWTGDFRQACEQAAQQRRLVLLHFYNDECEPCERVERNVFSRPEVAAAIARNYVPVKVHAGQNADLARRYQVARWPTDIAVTPAGLEIHRSTSPQLPEHYVELCDLMALKAGAGTDRRWAVNLQQVGQATLAPAAGAAQEAANQGQQQWNQSSQQLAGAVDQARGSAQQWGQQTQTAAQQYQQQAQDAGQQFQSRAADTAQQIQQQTQVAGQQFQGAAQQFGDSARSTLGQWQPPAIGGDLRAPANSGITFSAAEQSKFAPAAATAPPVSVSNPFIGQQAAVQQSASVPPQQQHPTAFQSQQPAAQQFVVASQAPPVSLDGFCPVTLLETKKWKKADPQFGAIHRGRTYLFASADQQKKFLANPDAFAPVLSGYDPVRFATTGQLVEGSRAHGLITPGDNRIFLFADEASLEQFKQSPRAFSEPAYQAMLRSETTPNYR